MTKIIGMGCFLLVGCVFMGVTAISMGVGAIYPPLNQIAAPVVCPDGEMVPTKTSSMDYDGDTIMSVDWVCVDDRIKERTELSILPISLISGTVYGLVLFVPLFLLGLIKSILSPRQQNPGPPPA